MEANTAVVILREVQRLDPKLYELAAANVENAVLRQQLAALQQNDAEEPETVDETDD